MLGQAYKLLNKFSLSSKDFKFNYFVSLKYLADKDNPSLVMIIISHSP